MMAPRAARLADFNAARDAGLSPTRAARWAAYVDLKRTQGQQPIALWEAALQCQPRRRITAADFARMVAPKPL